MHAVKDETPQEKPAEEFDPLSAALQRLESVEQHLIAQGQGARQRRPSVGGAGSHYRGGPPGKAGSLAKARKAIKEWSTDFLSRVALVQRHQVSCADSVAKTKGFKEMLEAWHKDLISPDAQLLAPDIGAVRSQLSFMIISMEANVDLGTAHSDF